MSEEPRDHGNSSALYQSPNDRILHGLQSSKDISRCLHRIIGSFSYSLNLCLPFRRQWQINISFSQHFLIDVVVQRFDADDFHRRLCPTLTSRIKDPVSFCHSATVFSVLFIYSLSSCYSVKHEIPTALTILVAATLYLCTLFFCQMLKF